MLDSGFCLSPLLFPLPFPFYCISPLLAHTRLFVISPSSHFVIVKVCKQWASFPFDSGRLQQPMISTLSLAMVMQCQYFNLPWNPRLQRLYSPPHLPPLSVAVNEARPSLLTQMVFGLPVPFPRVVPHFYPLPLFLFLVFFSRFQIALIMFVGNAHSNPTQQPTNTASAQSTTIARKKAVSQKSPSMALDLIIGFVS